MNHLGTLYLERGHPREAEPLFQQALFLYEQMEPGHPVGIHSLISQGWCYMQQERYQEAELLLEQTLSLLEQGGPQHLFIIHNVHYLGRLYTLQGFYQKAEECFQHGLALWEQMEFPHPCTARIFNGLASLCIRQGKHSEAAIVAIPPRRWLRRELSQARISRLMVSISPGPAHRLVRSITMS